jgi:hypothetical protein
MSLGRSLSLGDKVFVFRSDGAVLPALVTEDL